jgi:GNAT superfamily N-acetyltransferase
MGNTVDSGLSIRAMGPADLNTMADWAAAEGWNPGLADTSCFAVIDPAGFLIGEFEGKPAATISNVNYGDGFSFLGFYIVRPDLRGRGFGFEIWKAALAHSGRRVIGLDGVVAQQGNYRKSGFSLAYRNVRYGGVASLADKHAGAVALRDVPFNLLAAEDARCFPADRLAFLRAWIDAPGHVGRAFLRDGGLAAWGVIRPCRSGRRIGPLYASDREAAESVFSALVSSGDGEVFIDVPEPNPAAVELAVRRGLKPSFETARMYTGPVRPVAVGRLFGVSTLEIG